MASVVRRRVRGEERYEAWDQARVLSFGPLQSSSVQQSTVTS